MSVTMTKIAKEAGVSVALVSRLLRGDPTLRISKERRQAILRVRDNLGGVKLRRGQRRVLTRTILAPVSRAFSVGMVNANLADTQLIRSMETVLTEHDCRLHYSFFDVSRREEYFQSIVHDGRVCDGLLVLASLTDQWLADLLRQHEIANVSYDFHAEKFRINTVRAHTSDGIRQAVEYLRQLGHERIGFLGTAKNYRYSLVLAALFGAGLPVDERYHCITAEPERGMGCDTYLPLAREAMAGYLGRKGQKATALITANDYYAMGAIEAMREAGLTPGREISIVGHDNLERRGAEPTDNPIITTIDNPYDLIGRRMGELLLNQIEQRQTQVVHERIPIDLLVRQTTGPAPQGKDG